MRSGSELDQETAADDLCTHNSLSQKASRLAAGEAANHRILRLADKINGSPDLSSRKGFSRRLDRQQLLQESL